MEPTKRDKKSEKPQRTPATRTTLQFCSSFPRFFDDVDVVEIFPKNLVLVLLILLKNTHNIYWRGNTAAEHTFGSIPNGFVYTRYEAGKRTKP